MKKTIGVFFLSLVISLFLNQIVSANTTTYGWGMKPGRNGEKPDVGQLYESIISRHNAFYIDKTTSKRIYLTFDAGYENGYTSQILDVLKKQKVSATFFLVGDYLNKEEELVKRMVKEGHYIGNHTWSHPDLTKLSKEQYAEQLKKFEDRYTEITNKKLMKIMRPPSGTFSEKSLKIADELGYCNIFWSLAYRDWEIDRQHGWKYAYNQVMNRIHPGAIILMHPVSKDNAEALEKIIIDLRKQGYDFVPITSLFMPKTLYVNGF
ncbi:delta-lactam-biosynthetic de-N-acetylase [Mycoplasmatota bacterium]|nr:delta-lactam-biosynthetic de-N-acetylase [Mycoplasmatota bacterium]